MAFSAIELCAGGGGQALGLEMAGFHHSSVVEYESQFCTTLRTIEEYTSWHENYCRL